MWTFVVVSQKSSSRHARFEFFEPVEDNVDLVRGTSGGIRCPARHRQDDKELLAIRRDVVVSLRQGMNGAIDGERRDFSNSEGGLSTNVHAHQTIRGRLVIKEPAAIRRPERRAASAA